MDWTKLPTVDIEHLDTLDLDTLPMPWDDNPDVSGSEVNTAAGLDADLSHYRTPTTRTLLDLRANPEAVRHLARLPHPGETMHAVISGRYALWDLVPAILDQISPSTIDALHIATLSYSKANAAEVLTLLDTGKVKAVSLLVSHYFKGTNRQLYDALVPELLQRGHRVLAMRNHSKLILIQTTDNRYFTVESSANLRSCKNVETFTLTQCPELYQFHRRWIEEELLDREGKSKQ